MRALRFRPRSPLRLVEASVVNGQRSPAGQVFGEGNIVRAIPSLWHRVEEGDRPQDAPPRLQRDEHRGAECQRAPQAEMLFVPRHRSHVRVGDLGDVAGCSSSHGPGHRQVLLQLDRVASLHLLHQRCALRILMGGRNVADLAALQQVHQAEVGKGGHCQACHPDQHRLLVQ